MSRSRLPDKAIDKARAFGGGGVGKSERKTWSFGGGEEEEEEAGRESAPVFQRLTFQLIVDLGLLVELLAHLEVRHNARFRLHDPLSCPAHPPGGGKQRPVLPTSVACPAVAVRWPRALAPASTRLICRLCCVSPGMPTTDSAAPAPSHTPPSRCCLGAVVFQGDNLRRSSKNVHYYSQKAKGA